MEVQTCSELLTESIRLLRSAYTYGIDVEIKAL